MPSPAHRAAQGLCDGLADAARPQDVKLDGEICTYSFSIISNVVFVRADAARPQDVKLDGEICTYSFSIISNVVFVRADAARPQDVKLDGEICTYSFSIISNVVFVRADAARPQDEAGWCAAGLVAALGGEGRVARGRDGCVHGLSIAQGQSCSRASFMPPARELSWHHSMSMTSHALLLSHLLACRLRPVR